MPTSPFQQPSFRRNALASLIEEADQRGDTRELLLLKSQWVHRYGVDSMPTSSMVSEPITDWFAKEPLITDVPESDQVEIDPSVIEAAEIAVAEIEVAEIDEPMPDQLTIDDLNSEGLNSDALKQDEPEPEDLVAGTQDPVSEQAPLAEQPSVSEQPSSGDPSAVDAVPSRPLTAVRSMPAVASIPAPPISTPRSLRRWLPGADDQLPKAS